MSCNWQLPWGIVSRTGAVPGPVPGEHYPLLEQFTIRAYCTESVNFTGTVYRSGTVYSREQYVSLKECTLLEQCCAGTVYSLKQCSGWNSVQHRNSALN